MRAKYPLCVFVPELFIARGNIEAFAKKAADVGVWYIRVFLINSWAKIYNVPWQQAVYPAGSQTLVYMHKPSDGVVNCPVTDMRKFSMHYWASFERTMAILRKYGLGVIASLGDNCSQSPRNQKLSYPFNGALQTVSSDYRNYFVPKGAWALCTPVSGGLYGSSKWGYYQNWVRIAVMNLRKAGIPFRIEIQNEFSWLTWPKTATQPSRWYKMMVRALKDNDISDAQIVHSGAQQECIKYPGTFVMHRVAQAGMYPFAGDKARLMLSTDGAYNCKYAARSKTEISQLGHPSVTPADAAAMAKYAVQNGIWGGIEVMSQGMWSEDDYWCNVDCFNPEPCEAITQTWKK